MTTSTSSEIKRNWGTIEISKRRTDDYEFVIYESDKTTAVVLNSGDVVRFKLYRQDGTISLDIDSAAATANGSLVTVDDLDPATVTVRFAQDDTSGLIVGDYDGELLIVDDSETSPLDAIKVAAYGIVKVLKSGSGDVGKT
jgi:hypothetical protein